MFQIIKTKKYDAFFNCFVLFGFAMYLFSMQIRESSIMSINYLKLLVLYSIRFTFLMVIIKNAYDFLCGKFSFNEWSLFGVFFIYGLFIYLKDKEAVPLLVVLYMAAFKDIEYERIVKYSFYALSSCFFVIILSCFLPFVPYVSREFVREGSVIVRHSLGYTQHGYAPNYFMSITIMYLLLKKKFNNIEFLLIFIANLLIYIFVKTRSSFWCVIILLILEILSRINIIDFKKRILTILIMISFPIGALLSFLLTYLYRINVGFALKLNSMLTGRLKLMSDGFERWKVTLFGQVTGMYDSSEYVYIDSAYMNVFFNLGIVTLIIVVLFYMLYTYLSSKNKNDAMLIVLFVTSIHSVFDPQLTLLNYSPFMVLFIHMLKEYLTNKTVMVLDNK